MTIEATTVVAAPVIAAVSAPVMVADAVEAAPAGIAEIAGTERTAGCERMRGHIGVAACRGRPGHGEGQHPGRKQCKKFFHNPLLKQYRVPSSLKRS